MSTRCFTQCSNRIDSLILEQMRVSLAGLQPKRIVLKPNWVLHESDPSFPIRALVTDARVIRAAIQACLELFPKVDSILIGDCPLQSCEWPKMCQQSGLSAVIEHFQKTEPNRVKFRDLRREVFHKDSSGFMIPSDTEHGDPEGYREVCLGARSHLEPISDQADRFAVNDYTSSVTRSNHKLGDHRYLVSQSVLNSDLFINLPKWKSHAKSGLTCALKNLVGINGDKAYLPHFRRGAPKWGGDEYTDESRWLYWAQTTLRESLQKRSQWAFRLLKPGWELIKRMRGMETKLRSGDARPKEFYTAGGAWYGNQTIWRMIYDLNLIIQCVSAKGELLDRPARTYFCIVDGLISGEGNGPLEPLPKETHWLSFGNDPFEIDASLAWFMGFDPMHLPIVSQRESFLGPNWGDFDLARLNVEVDHQPVSLMDSPINLQFVPPPGWREHIERERRLAI